MSHQEEKINKFLDYPYDSFLMLRLEFMLIFNDELTAKILRIIEKNVETERKHIYRKTVNKMGSVPTEVVEITTDIWVSISYKTFMTDLFGTVNSENTLKRAIKELERMKVIFRRHEPKKKYDAPQYKIHQSVLQMLLSVLKIPGYQTLIPSIFEALKLLPPQELTPSECQNLIPSTEILSTNTKLRVSNFDPTYNNSNNKDNDNKDTYSDDVANANHHVPAPLSLEEMVAHLQANGYHISQEQQPELSTPGKEISPESVDKSGQNVEETSVPLQASVQSPIVSTTTQNTPAVVGDTPPSEKPARPPRQRKPKEDKVAKPSLSEEEKSLRKEVLDWINAKRGYKLYGRATAKEIQVEYSCGHTLAHMLYVRLHEHNEEEGCTWEDLEYSHEYCSKRDTFWKQPENKIRIGTFAVLQKFAVAMALKVQQPLINLEDRRNGIVKQTALEHGSRPAQAPLTADEIRNTPVWGNLKGAK